MDTVANKWLEYLLTGDPGKDNLAVGPEINIGVSAYRFGNKAV